MKSTTKKEPVLKHFAAFWTLSRHPSQEKEWLIDEKFKQAKAAGFDAVGGWDTPGILPLCEKYEMDFIFNFNGNKDYRQRLDAGRTVNPARINVQHLDHDTSPKQAVALWLKIEAYAKKLGLEVDLEVHRDTCTETPEKVEEIAAIYRKETGKNIRYCWDFSHLAVVKHLNPPYAARLLTQPKLIQISRQFHFRPFNGHHAQVPVTDGKGHESYELGPYLEFVDALFACWLAGAKGGEVLWACPELGPFPDYGLSTFPNVWEDAVYLRGKIEALWKKNLRNWKK